MDALNICAVIALTSSIDCVTRCRLFSRGQFYLFRHHHGLLGTLKNSRSAFPGFLAQPEPCCTHRGHALCRQTRLGHDFIDNAVNFSGVKIPLLQGQVADFHRQQPEAVAVFTRLGGDDGGIQRQVVWLVISLMTLTIPSIRLLSHSWFGSPGRTDLPISRRAPQWFLQPRCCSCPPAPDLAGMFMGKRGVSSTFFSETLIWSMAETDFSTDSARKSRFLTCSMAMDISPAANSSHPRKP